MLKIANIHFPPHNNRCVFNTVYKVLTQVLKAKSKAYYSGGIGTHHFCNSRAASLNKVAGLNPTRVLCM